LPNRNWNEHEKQKAQESFMKLAPVSLVFPLSFDARQLKTKPHRELHLARRPRSERLSERRVDLLPCRCIENGSCIDRVELRVIEHVVKFPPERQYTLFISQDEVPEQSRIEVAPPRSAHCILGSISDIAPARERNARGVEHATNALVGVTQVRIASEIHSLSIRSATAA
jgi:hypothetical protein